MPDNSDNNKRIAKNTFLLYGRMIFVMLVSLYTTRVVLRVLGVDDFGIYNVVAGFVSMFGIFNTCFSTSINRYYNFAIGQKLCDGIKKVYSAGVAIQLLIAVLVFILVEGIGIWYLNNKMVIVPERLYIANWIFQFAVISLLFTIMQAPYSAAVLAFERMDYYAIVSIVDVLLKLIFIVLLQYVTVDKLLFYGAIMTLVSIINFLLYFIYCRRKFKDMKWDRNIDKSTFKSMFSFAGWSTIDPLTYLTRDQGTNLVLNSFFGTVVNAAQGIAYQINAAVDSFSSSLSTSFRPQIIQSYSEGNYVRTKTLMLSMSKLCFILHIMLIVPICFEINGILTLWLGADFPQYTPIFAILLLVTKAINSLNTPISNVMVATGKIKKIKIVSAIILCSIVPIAIVLFRLGCSPWAVYAGLISLTLINQIACVKILTDTFPFVTTTEYIKTIVIPCICFAIAVIVPPAVVVTLFHFSILRIFSVFIISVVLSLVFGYFIILNKSERTLALSFFSKMLKKL